MVTFTGTYGLRFGAKIRRYYILSSQLYYISRGGGVRKSSFHGHVNMILTSASKAAEQEERTVDLSETHLYSSTIKSEIIPFCQSSCILCMAGPGTVQSVLN